MPGLIDHAHAAPPQFLKDFVISQYRRHFRSGDRLFASVEQNTPHEDAANGRGGGGKAVQVIFQYRLLA